MVLATSIKNVPLSIAKETGDCQWTMQSPLPIFKPVSMARRMEYTHWLDLDHGLAREHFLEIIKVLSTEDKWILEKQKQVLLRVNL